MATEVTLKVDVSGKKLVSKVIRFQRSPLKQAQQMSYMNVVTERHENGYERVCGHGCRHGYRQASAFKGTVARDFWPLVFFMNRPYMGP